MADRLVQQNPRPASSQHDRHDSGRSVHGAEIEDRLPGCFPSVVTVAVPLTVKGEADTASSTERPDLAVAMFLRNAGDLEPGEGLHIPHQQPFRGRHDDDLVLRVEGGHDVFDPGVVAARLSVNQIQQINPLVRGNVGYRGLRRVQISIRPLPMGHRQAAGPLRRIGNVSGRIGRDLKVLPRELVRIGKAGFLARRRPNADPLRNAFGRPLDDPLFHRHRLRDPGLEIEVGVIHIADLHPPERLANFQLPEAKLGQLGSFLGRHLSLLLLFSAGSIADSLRLAQWNEHPKPYAFSRKYRNIV